MTADKKESARPLPPATTPNVALLVDTATDWGRRILRGIIQYTYERGPWNLWLKPNVQEHAIRLPPGWRGHGIIARVANRSTHQHIKAAGVPAVNVCSARIAGVDLPRVTVDLDAAARISAEYYLGRGFQNFAFYGPLRYSYVRDFLTVFEQMIAAAGRECHVFHPKVKLRGKSLWQARQRELQHWLEQLPKPIAIVAWATVRGQEIINACRASGIIVPEQVSVFASDDDSLLCRSCNPPLSGLSLSTERIGYEAATLLDRLMRGEKPQAKTILIEPGVLTERQSTETLAIDDDELAQAVAFIRNHASQPIQVADVLRNVPISRRELERRMQKTIGRTPALEIRRVHVELAKRLLMETSMTIPDVAAASGFASREHFAQLFKRETGSSPLRFRRKHLAR